VNDDRVAYLDGIRGLAICMVLALHWGATYVPFFHAGALGVDVFFVLSGFNITTLLWRGRAGGSVRSSWLRFLRRRVVRLYPAVVGLVVGTTVLYAVTPGAQLVALTVLRRGAILLVQGVDVWIATTGPTDGAAVQPFVHTWSLATEWHFYLVWPLVLLGLRHRLSARRAAAVTGGAAVVLYAAALPLPYLWFYLGPLSRSAELLAGAALALWLQYRVAGPSRGSRRARAAHGLSAVALAVLCLVVLLGPHSNEGRFYAYVGVPVAVAATGVLIWAGTRHPGGLVHALLSHRVPAFLGTVSYSLYLWHEVPMVLLEDAWPGVPRPLVGLVVVLSTVVLTALSFRFLERPFLRSRSSALRPSVPAPVLSADVRRLDGWPILRPTAPLPGRSRPLLGSTASATPRVGSSTSARPRTSAPG
jgi:peptidoglycan/LPS O-acetylase OafA/YrhL